jgi:hypothetical protein
MSETMPVPARWRVGQLVVLALIGALAAYFYFRGWKSPPGSEAATRAQDSRGLADMFGFGVLAGLAWLCTPAAGVIAVTTVQEALRRRWIVVLTVFSVFLLLFSRSFTGLQPGEEERFLQDFGMLYITTVTLLISIFWAWRWFRRTSSGARSSRSSPSRSTAPSSSWASSSACAPRCSWRWPR